MSEYKAKHGWVVKFKKDSKFGKPKEVAISKTFESRQAADDFLSLAIKTYPTAYKVEV